MNRDKAFGLGLSGISMVAAIGAGIYFAIAGESIPLAMLAWPALGLMLGIAITFFNFVEVGLNIDDEIEQFPQLVQDDIDDLRSGIVTSTHFFVALTLIAAGIEVGLLLWYRKGEASWGSINILFIALVVVMATLILSLRADWFQLRQHRLAGYIYVIPAIGWLICIVIGVRYAEPIEYGGLSPMERRQLVRSEGFWASTRAGTGYFIMDSVDTAGYAISSIDCDGEGCLILLLIGVVVICVLGSALIPHFWVVATTLLLTLMSVITLREMLYSDA